jgi:hypothetical protein
MPFLCVGCLRPFHSHEGKHGVKIWRTAESDGPGKEGRETCVPSHEIRNSYLLRSSQNDTLQLDTPMYANMLLCFIDMQCYLANRSLPSGHSLS